MYKYVIKRLLLTIPVLAGVVFIVFTILSLTPGDTARAVLGANADREAIEAFNEEHGLNQPYGVRLLRYYKDIVTLNFGRSYRDNKPVMEKILARFPTTLKLALLSITLSGIVGVFLGVISAVRQYSLLDNIARVSAMIFASVPSFWLGMMLILVFALHLRVLPSNGLDSWKNYVLPLVTLTVTGAAGILRITRSSMLETIRQDYIRTARAKGANRADVVIKHALRNAMLPVITTLGVSFGASLGGAVVIETVFSIPGVGLLIVNAIRQKDIPLIMCSIVFLSTMFCLVMLAVDIAFAFIDPRVKAKYVSKRGLR